MPLAGAPWPVEHTRDAMTHSLKEQLRLFETMLRIRLFEEKVDSLFARGLIHGTSHLCVGQEPVAVGAVEGIRPDDYVVSNHRGHGHLIARGADVRRLMAELMGKETGYCRGKGGSQHICWMKAHFVGTNGITGGGLPIATGVAFSIRYRRASQVALVFFGDGAANQGTFHESLNMASIWDLPIVYLCENNLYAMSTHMSRAMKVADVAERAKAYAMPGHVVDGTDLFAVRDVVAQAAERARSGRGPTLIEAKTYRYLGHSKSDQRVYRTREEEEEWRRRDLIALMRAELETSAGAETVGRLVEKVREEIEEAVRFAQESPAAGREVAYGTRADTRT